jgi:hypothetical protein
MCWSVYIATPQALSGVTFSTVWPEDGSRPPALHFEEILDEEDEGTLYRPFFKGKHLYNVGSDSGCGCNLQRSYIITTTPEETIFDYYADESPLAFIDFIKNHSRETPLEMYVVWEDDRRLQPLENVAIDAKSLTIDSYFKLVSRRFYTFYG